MAIVLRPYQNEARDSILGEWESGNQKTLLISSTGTGKTEMGFSALAAERERCIEQGKPFRAAWLAHTSELLQQPKERIALNWRGKLPVPGIVQASVNECDAEIIVATVQTLAPRRVSNRAPVFSHKGEQRFIEADTEDKHLQIFDEFGEPIKVKVPKGLESSMDPANCRFVYANGAPVMTNSFERATFENYRPYAGRFEPRHDENGIIGVEAIATGRRLRMEANNLGFWRFVYEDTGKPYIVPESKAHPLRQFGRLRQILEHGKITHLVIDEAHHSPAVSYRQIVRALTAVNPDIRILGVTATPYRSDKIKMSAVFDSIAYEVDLFRAIYLLRCLCNYELRGVALPVDAADIVSASKTEEFTKSEFSKLGEVMSATHALNMVVDTWEQQAADRKTMIYTGSVEHARLLCEAFQARGHAAAWADGSTPKTERTEIVKDFRHGKTQILVNCLLWTEGLDVPEISCVILACLVKSLGRFLQMLGRGLRNHPTKDALNPKCLALLFCPQDTPEYIRNDQDILGNRAEQLKQVRKAQEEGQDDETLAILGELESTLLQGEISEVLSRDTYEPRQMIVKRFDFFQSESPLDWFVDNTIATASIAKNHIMAVVSPQIDRLETAQELIQSGNWKPEWDEHLDKLRSYQLYAINGRLEMIQMYSDWDDAKKAAQVYADEFTDKHIGHAKSSWRERPPSAKQVQRAREAGVENPGRYERAGDLSKAITHADAQAALKRAKVIK